MFHSAIWPYHQDRPGRSGRFRPRAAHAAIHAAAGYRSQKPPHAPGKGSRPGWPGWRRWPAQIHYSPGGICATAPQPYRHDCAPLRKTNQRPTRARRPFVVSGVVQGVGFRPFVYNLAVQHGLAGFIGNDSSGVFVEVEGLTAAIAAAFRAGLVEQPPPLAHVERTVEEAVEPLGESGFMIVPSPALTSRTPWFRPTSVSATRLWLSCSIRPTGATVTRSSTAPAAAHASASFGTSPTTGPRPPWRPSSCAKPARPNTTTHPTATSRATQRLPGVWAAGEV